MGFTDKIPMFTDRIFPGCRLPLLLYHPAIKCADSLQKLTVMKIYLLILLTFFFLLPAHSVFAQNNAPKEVLIIGTMHHVPDVVKNSYKPLLKRAKRYAPEAIYIEAPQPWDTVSLKNSYPKFYAKADSLCRTLQLDRKQVETALHKDLDAMSREDFQLLHQFYTIQRDPANAEFYHYLFQHGTEGSPKPTQEEDGDLTAKLAIHLNIRKLYSMDNQWYRREYHQAWAQCAKADRKDGEIKNLKKLYNSLTFPEIFNALLGRTGVYNNSKTATQKYHILNSFRYRETTCAPCEEGTKYWDLRNREMARNIGRQIQAHDHQRSVVIVGAGHVTGLREALRGEFPEIKIKLVRGRKFNEY
jgi:hypothetical protein